MEKRPSSLRQTGYSETWDTRSCASWHKTRKKVDGTRARGSIKWIIFKTDTYYDYDQTVCEYIRGLEERLRRGPEEEELDMAFLSMMRELEGKGALTEEERLMLKRLDNQCTRK